MLNALHKPLAIMLLVAAPLLWLLSTWLFALAKEDEAKPPAVLKPEEVPVM